MYIDKVEIMWYNVITVKELIQMIKRALRRKCANMVMYKGFEHKSTIRWFKIAKFFGV